VFKIIQRPIDPNGKRMITMASESSCYSESLQHYGFTDGVT
jgi:hypothetical protein